MKNRPRRWSAVATLLALSISSSAAAAELSPAIREAERLYQSGRFTEAVTAAHEVYRYFPDDFQALIILGMSNFHAGNYLKASDWLKLAAAKSPRHPLVVRYSELLREIEYRSGPFSKNPDRRDPADKKTTAEFYKRQFFGPSFAVPSGQNNPWAQAAPLEPVLIKKPLPVETTFLAAAHDRPPSRLALPTPYPTMESIISTEAMAEMAERALAQRNYRKSYLFFSQLNATEPNNRRFAIGKAESAFHMKRYQQVLEILGPLAAAGQAANFSDQQWQKVGQLMEKSRKQVFSNSLK